MKHSEQINELATALSKAQKQFEAAERAHVAKVTSKKGEGSSYSFNYADLQAYLDVCRGPLGDNGLSFVQEPTCEGNVVSVTTLLLHSSGQWIESAPLKLVLTGETLTPQVIGSGVTYGRRYSLSALIGMASEQDDDGNHASGNTASTGPREALPDCPKCGTNKSTIVGKAEYGGGFVCFKKKNNGCGHTWGGTKDAPPEPPPAANGASAKAAAEKYVEPEEFAKLAKVILSMGVPRGNKEHFNAVTIHAAKVTYDDCVNVKGSCDKVLEKLIEAQGHGHSLESIYTNAKIEAELASDLETAGAAAFG